MIAPRDIYELADTVEAEVLAQDGADLEQVGEFVSDIQAMVRGEICQCRHCRRSVNFLPTVQFSPFSLISCVFNTKAVEFWCD